MFCGGGYGEKLIILHSRFNYANYSTVGLVIKVYPVSGSPCKIIGVLGPNFFLGFGMFCGGGYGEKLIILHFRFNYANYSTLGLVIKVYPVSGSPCEIIGVLGPNYFWNLMCFVEGVTGKS